MESGCVAVTACIQCVQATSVCCNASCGHVGVAIHKKFLPLVDCCSGEVILHCYIRCCSNMQAGSLYGADVMLAIRCNVEVCFSWQPVAL